MPGVLGPCGLGAGAGLFAAASGAGSWPAWASDHWLLIGFLGQGVFTARFIVQWAASERKRDSVIPVAFWWLSMLGGMILLSYAVHRQDPVIIAGQSMGVFIYMRNLMLVAKGKHRAIKERDRTLCRSRMWNRKQPPSRAEENDFVRGLGAVAPVPTRSCFIAT